MPWYLPPRPTQTVPMGESGSSPPYIIPARMSPRRAADTGNCRPPRYTGRFHRDRFRQVTAKIRRTLP